MSAGVYTLPYARVFLFPAKHKTIDSSHVPRFGTVLPGVVESQSELMNVWMESTEVYVYVVKSIPLLLRSIQRVARNITMGVLDRGRNCFFGMRRHLLHTM